MEHMKRWGAVSLVLVACVVLSVSQISCAKKAEKGKPAVTVNSYLITAQEFNELFAEARIPEDTPKTRQGFLDNLVMRKLLMQEAQREGLDKDKDFLKSVERFWEQSLLKIMVDKKVREFPSDIGVSDQEIEAYYKAWVEKNPENQKAIDEMREPIRKQLIAVKQVSAFNAWVEELKKKAKIRVDKQAIGIE